MDFLTLNVKRIISLTEDAASIQFVKPQGQQGDYQAGQFLTLIQTINGKEVRRAYSLCSSPNTDEFWAIGVKRVKEGIMSNWLLDTLKAGDTIKAMAPMGTFILPPPTTIPFHLILVAAGSGITPLLSICKFALSSNPATQVTLIYGNRTENGIMFQEELQTISDTYAHRFRLVHTLTQPSQSYTGLKGRITGERVSEILEHARVVGFQANNQVFMCGPQAMMDSVQESLISIGYLKSSIHRESFTSSTDEETKIQAQESAGVTDRTVTVILNGKEFAFVVPKGVAILEAALDQDIDLPYSCQSGLCTACRGKCLSGKVHLDEREGLSDSEMDEGYVLTCVGHPLTDNVLIEIG
jgi:ring-1,2-phenylacetyl-CoA epoxidase subunit PaaE